MRNTSKILLLAALCSIAAGRPVEFSNHQIVEVPHSSSSQEEHPTNKHHVLYRGSLTKEMTPRQPEGNVHRATVAGKLERDHNDISQPLLSEKQSFKPENTFKNMPVAGKKGPKKSKKSNADLLHHLGMTRLRSPTINHHRKRLASQSRKTHNQKSNSDSKMFVIKLPPNPYYYAHHDLNGYDVVESHPKSVNKLPVNFNTNGKPSRVYHWNIPVLKKMVARKAGSSGKTAVFADSDIFNIDKQSTWNETDDDKSVYRKATFYGPKKQSKYPFRKYFSGNGKPHSFYVMEKSKKPASVYRLLP